MIIDPNHKLPRVWSTELRIRSHRDCLTTIGESDRALGRHNPTHLFDRLIGCGVRVCEMIFEGSLNSGSLHLLTFFQLQTFHEEFDMAQVGFVILLARQYSNERCD